MSFLNDPAALKVNGWEVGWGGVGFVAYSNYLYPAGSSAICDWINNLTNYRVSNNTLVTSIFVISKLCWKMSKNFTRADNFDEI